MSNQGFNKNSGPGAGIPKQQPQFGFRPPSQSPSSWFNGPSSKPEVRQIPAIPPPFITPRGPGPDFLARPQVQDLKRTRSPPLISSSTYKDALQNSKTLVGSHPVPPRTKSPPHVYLRNHPVPLSETKRPSISPSRLNARQNNNAESQTHVWPQPSVDLYNKPERPAINASDLPVLKRSRLPFSPSTDPMARGNNVNISVDDDSESHPVPQRTKSPPHVYLRNHPAPSSETKRPSISPPRLNTRPNNNADPQSHVWPQPSTDLYNKLERPSINPSDLPVSKRSRLPFSPLTDPMARGNNVSVDDDSERELQAKAKRLARFKDELSQPEPSDKNQKTQQVVEKRKFAGEGSDNSNVLPDGEDQESSTVIIGFCPDMCPEQERAERERKGDLDQYERLDGDRNQTTGSLAVKKYTRTAEREAALIRPMPILQKTMNYLLGLLDQPYDDRLLALYNFLWDRMRAIRMDLRMQHIFNLGAITMLEQMIRLHIIAMHELCQYTKGEGFSEGFDAHLNIEQMNKTSVELFQLYDDHRKKGIDVPTEREFRGYYALLKLDKHPGYKVEPSELSLDLAKMTPALRQAGEVLFARNVARACRSGNFIAFFRLVRKASYLQACLMHAHFGKLRTQALASLHSGLQNNQGIPLTQVAKWLGMEEENMEDLMEYHGFSIKEFDEPYMVKEGQFLNGDTEYSLKCSKLVHLKRSTTIVDDVSSSSIMESSPPKRVPLNIPSLEKKSPPVIHKETKNKKIFKPIDVNMTNFQPVSTVKDKVQVLPIFQTPVPKVADRLKEDRHHIEVASPSPREIFKSNNNFISSPKGVATTVAKPSFDTRLRKSLEKRVQSNVFTIPPQVVPENVVVETLPDIPMDSSVEEPTVNSVFVQDMEPEEPENMIEEVPNEIDNSLDEEVAEAKLKLIIRLWRRRASIKKDLREKKQLAATAALSSLSLGPPMRHYEEQSKVFNNFNIDRAMLDRFEKQEQLRSTLNVSDVVAATLRERNQHARCICWKLLFCSSDPDASWLQHKLMPENNDNNDDLLASSPGLSIWKKWEYGKSSNDLSCYLSVVKNVQFDNNNNTLEETASGASAVIFVTSESISWEAQKTRLLNVISSLPWGSCLPLLILDGSHERYPDSSFLVKNLSFHEIDHSRIASYMATPFFKSKNLDRFSSDKDLRKGLKWLARKSPIQPVVHHVKTRELILTNLKFKFDAHKTNPKKCVSAINNSIDESIRIISHSVNTNPSGWPCPEVLLLNESDLRIIEPYLPSIGWSSVTKIEPLIHALQNCKLPTIPNNRSWCRNINIENQRLELEDFLVSYLTPLTGSFLAQKEASMLLQSCVGLELHGSTYTLVPKWVTIFRRIFNWQLMSLSNGVFSTAYILEEHNASFSASESFEDELCSLNSPSLDEMIEVSGCMHGSELDYEGSRLVVYDPPEVEMVVGEDDLVQEERSYVENESTENESKENERRLSRLLEQCNIVQDNIDKKLSVYF